MSGLQIHIPGELLDEGNDDELSFPTAEAVFDRLEELAERNDSTQLPDLRRELQEPLPRESAALMWAESFRARSIGLEILAPYRLQVFWRTTRWLAEARGMVYKGEGLDEAIHRRPDALHARAAFGHSPRRWAATQVFDVMLNPNPLPCVPNRTMIIEEVRRLQAAHLLVAYLLRIPAGSPKEPLLGQLGLKGMRGTPEAFVRLFPDADLIISYEADLVEEATRLLATRTFVRARKFLIDRRGLRPAEVESVMAMARARCQRLTKGTAEENQAAMVLRLQDLADRARKAMDLKAEMNAVKNLIVVQGLREAADGSREKELMRLLKDDRLDQEPVGGKLSVTVGAADDGTDAEDIAQGGPDDADATGGFSP